jgi:hypothetical protein
MADIGEIYSQSLHPSYPVGDFESGGSEEKLVLGRGRIPGFLAHHLLLLID